MLPSLTEETKYAE